GLSAEAERAAAGPRKTNGARPSAGPVLVAAVCRNRFLLLGLLEAFARVGEDQRDLFVARLGFRLAFAVVAAERDGDAFDVDFGAFLRRPSAEGASFLFELFGFHHLVPRFGREFFRVGLKG